MSNTVDVKNSQLGVNAKQGEVLDKMKALAEEAKGDVSQKRLTEIQLELDDLKRTYDVLKSVNETLKGVQESGSKFPQSR